MIRRVVIHSTICIALAIVIFLQIIVLQSRYKDGEDGIFWRAVGSYSERNVSSPTIATPSISHSAETSAIPTRPSKIKVAFLVPARSITGWSISDIPLLKIFLPTLSKSIDSQDLDLFEYHLYLGFDIGDELYDNDTNLEALYSIVETVSPVRLHTSAFANTRGKPVLVWNRLFEEAFNDGCHYFYQVNDDVRFLSPGWSKVFIDTLRQNPVFPDLGVVGPKDIGASIMTQSFVSRMHMHIFGYLYPPLFENWYSDDWMTGVYQDSKCAFPLGFQVANDNSQGTRYNVAMNGRDFLEILTMNGKNAVSEFLQTHIPGPDLMSDPLHQTSAHRLRFRLHGSHRAGDTIRLHP